MYLSCSLNGPCSVHCNLCFIYTYGSIQKLFWYIPSHSEVIHIHSCLEFQIIICDSAMYTKHELKMSIHDLYILYLICHLGYIKCDHWTSQPRYFGHKKSSFCKITKSFIFSCCLTSLTLNKFIRGVYLYKIFNLNI